ncbi:MAG TPA: DivIVA domain-containing protein [Gemmatimonadales bacterium]|jgi:DivIVA domain-containing protein|nr:DivIVA domain-containing protein [Gemmatimonadales bacterium]
MTSDVFHLTPHDIRSQEFHKVMRGYDRLQVDDFRGRVADEMERLLRERAQLEERIRNFQEQLRAFREREKAMNDALVAAQQLREEVKAQADLQAETILREARAESMRIVSRSHQEDQQLRERTEALHRQFATYLASFRALLERHLGEVEGYQAHTQVMSQVQTELLLKRQA